MPDTVRYQPVYLDLTSDTLPTPARAVLYTVETGSLTELQSITLINSSGGAATVNVFLVHDGVSIRLNPTDLLMDAGDLAELIDKDIQFKPMEGGDTLEGVSDVAGVEINVVAFEK